MEKLTQGNERRTCGRGNERINALDGNDVIYAGGGSDTVDAGAVLFVRETSKFKAANDRDYQPLLERSAA